MKINRLSPDDINFDGYKRTIKKCGDYLEVTALTYRQNVCPIEKLSKTQYKVKKTGEIKEFKQGFSRIDNIAQVKASHARLRDIINSNVSSRNIRQCKWVTLTYAENMTDFRRLYDDFKKFVQRLKYKYKYFEYISAPEPQGRGAWHLHIIMIFPQKTAPFIPCDELESIWGLGSTSISRIKSSDNVGFYLTSYLGNLPTNDTTDTKKYEKGARLCLYPKGIRFFRYSKGIKMPEIQVVFYDTSKKILKGAKLKYERSFQIEFENGSTIEVLKQYYRQTELDIKNAYKPKLLPKNTIFPEFLHQMRFVI